MKRIAVFFALLMALAMTSGAEAASPSRISLSPSTVSGGETVNATLYLASKAPTGGERVTLSSSSSLADVPSSVTVPSGKNVATFTIDTTVVTSRKTAVITATANGVSKTATLTIDPVSLSSITVSPTTVTANTSATMTIKLNGKALSGGFQVSLSSSSSRLSVPSSITIPAGQKQATVTVESGTVSASTTVTLTASAQGVVKTTKPKVVPLEIKSLSASPSVTSGRSITPKLSMNGLVASGGANVTLTSSLPDILPVPATVTVTGGTSSLAIPLTAGFVTAPQNVTITATYRGVTVQDVITVNPVVVSSLSLSPSSITGSLGATLKITLTSEAPEGGYEIDISTSNSGSMTIPPAATVPAGIKIVSIPIETALVSQPEAVTITTSLNGASKSIDSTIKPVSIASFTGSTSIVGGVERYVDIVLTTAAPAGGIVVSLASTDSGIVQLPETVLIPAGSDRLRVYFTPGVVSDDSSVSVTAADPFTSKTLVFTVRKAKLLNFNLSPGSTIGGTSVKGTVVLSGPAPEEGITVTVTSENPIISSFQVNVPAGENTRDVYISVPAVGVKTDVPLKVSLDSVTVSTKLTINPPALRDLIPRPLALAKGSTSQMTLRLTGRAPAGGLDVALQSSVTSVATVPASVTVPAGATSVTIPVTSPTSATIGASTNIRATLGTAYKEAAATITTLSLSSFTLSSNSVIGGTNVNGTITLTGNAPSGGLAVSVYTVDSSVTPAASIVVPSGKSTVTFVIETDWVSAGKNVVVYATFATSGLSQDLNLMPISATSLDLGDWIIEGGEGIMATLTLDGPAPTTGTPLIAEIDASSGMVIVPGSVTFDPGSRTVSFQLSAHPVAEETDAIITATVNGSSVTAYLYIIPPSLEAVLVDEDEVAGGQSVTGTIILSSAAPEGGWEISLFASSELVSVPPSVVVPAGQFWGSFTMATSAVSEDTEVWVSGERDGVEAADSVILLPAKLTSLTVDDKDLEGGFANATGTVHLGGEAPEGGWVVNLSSSNPAALSVPATVTVAEGESSATFDLVSQLVTADTTVTITASNGALAFSQNVVVRYVGVTTLSLSSSSVTGGTGVNGTVSINRALPVGASMVVNLGSANSAATAPITVTLTTGQTSKSFAIATTAVAVATSGDITADFNGSAAAGLTIVPPVPDSFTITPGSVIGGAANAVGTVTLNGPAPAGGATVSLGATGSGATTPASVTVAAGETSASFTVTTSMVLATSTVSVSATYQSVTLNAQLTVVPVPLVGVALSPSSVVGGAANATGTVTLGVAAPVGGVVVTLASSDTSRATVPATITVPAGQISATFSVSSNVVPTSGMTVVTASHAGTSKTANLTVTPLLVTSVSLSKTSVQGGNEHPTATVTLNAAPLADTTIILTSGNTNAATVPATVIVLAGETTATFPVTTSFVTSTSSSGIGAAFNGGSKSATLSVTALTVSSISLSPTTVVGGLAGSTGTVNLNVVAVAAVTVALSSGDSAAQIPDSVTVAAGQKTATFAITTSFVQSQTVAAISGSFNTTQKSSNLTINVHAVTKVTLNKTSLVGGAENFTATVTLSAAAPAGGTVVGLAVDTTTHASVPAAVTVSEGATTATFTVTTVRVATTAAVTVSASYNGTSATVTGTVAGPTISSVVATPDQVGGGISTSGTVTLTSAAPDGGFVVDLSASNSAGLVPATVTVSAGSTTAVFEIVTKPVTANRSVTIEASGNGTSKTEVIVVKAATVSSLAVNPASVVGGQSFTATVTLSSPAPSGGILVAFTSNVTSGTIAEVTVPAGGTTGSVSIPTPAVASNLAATLTATANSTSASASVTILAPVITSFEINPESVKGGKNATGTITISSPAPAGGLTITLTDNSGNVTPPSSVTVPAGATSVSFTITTKGVSSTQTKIVTARLNNVNTTAEITLTKN